MERHETNYYCIGFKGQLAFEAPTPAFWEHQHI